MKHPSNFGRYEVIKLLGRGAMGKVFLARDPVIGREVAIKVFDAHAGLEGDELEEVMGRFQREFRSAGTLTHPHVVTVYDVGQQDDHPFMAMEYVVGETLESILRTGRTLTFKEVADLALQLGAALDYAHDKGIVHRDVKPANTMITWDGVAKLTDFGVAKMASSTMTRTGTIVGTPAYMAPEQITGYEVTGASDQFSLAVIIYQLLTGERPFTGDSPTAILYKIVHEDPSEPKQLNAALPAPVNAVLIRALDKDPTQRYPSCAVLAEAVRAALGAAPSASTLRTVQWPAQSGAEGTDEASTATNASMDATIRMDGDPSLETARAADGPIGGRGPDLVMPSDPGGRGRSSTASEPRSKGAGRLLAVLLVLAVVAGLAVWQQQLWWPQVMEVLGQGSGAQDDQEVATSSPGPEGAEDVESLSPETAEDTLEAPELRVELPTAGLQVGDVGGDVAETPLSISVDGEPAILDDGGTLVLSGAATDERRIVVRQGETVVADGMVRLGDLATAPAGWMDALVAAEPPRVLLIDSRPQSAQVLLDGEPVGQTPVTVELREADAYDLRVELEGHKSTGMRLDYDQLPREMREAGRLFFPLERDIDPGVVVVGATYPVAMVMPDGTRHGPKASLSVSLDPGRYKVSLEAPQVFYRQEVELEVVSGETVRLSTPSTVAITVTAVPGNCQVSIDGREVDFTPLRDLPVVAGPHEVTFYWPGLERTETRTEVISADNRQLTARASR